MLRSHFGSSCLGALCRHFGSSWGIVWEPTLVVPGASWLGTYAGTLGRPVWGLVVPGTSDTLTDAWQFLPPSAHIETVFLHRLSPLAFRIGWSLIKLLPPLQQYLLTYVNNSHQEIRDWSSLKQTSNVAAGRMRGQQPPQRTPQVGKQREPLLSDWPQTQSEASIQTSHHSLCRLQLTGPHRAKSQTTCHAVSTG